jgi:hypothetical protein
MRFHLIGGSMQGVADEVREVWMPLRAVAGSAHYSRSNTERSADMPRAV